MTAITSNEQSRNQSREELRLAAEIVEKLTEALAVRDEVIADTRAFVEKVYPLLFPEKK